MIVATRAGHRQAKESPGNRIDAVIHRLRIALRKFPSQTQEAERRQVTWFDAGYAIGRKLIEHEAIVRQILIERPDHPVAIGVRPRDIAARRSPNRSPNRRTARRPANAVPSARHIAARPAAGRSASRKHPADVSRTKRSISSADGGSPVKS